MTSDFDGLARLAWAQLVAGHDRGARRRGGREALLSRPAPPGLRALDAGCRQVDRAALLE